MTTVNQSNDSTSVSQSNDDTTVTTGSSSTSITVDGGATTAAALPFTAAGGLAADDVQEALQELDTEKVAKAGDTMTGTLTTTGIDPTWHDGSAAQNFADEPGIVMPGSTRKGGVFFDASTNHMVFAEWDGSEWEPIGYLDHATGFGCNSLIRFFSDAGFDTGFIGQVAGTSLLANRIGVGLGTNFTDLNYDNPTTSLMRWWFGTDGDYDFVPGKHNAYDIGEAVRAVKTLHVMTVTAQTAVTVGGTNVLLDSADSVGSDNLAAETPETVSGTTETAANADHQTVKLLTHATGCTITLPNGLTAGTTVTYIAKGAGTYTFANDGTSSIESKDSALSIDGQYAAATAIHQGSDVWSLFGALA